MTASDSLDADSRAGTGTGPIPDDAAPAATGPAAVTAATGPTAAGSESDGTGEPGGAGVLSRSYRALSVGLVSVILVIAFEAMAVGTAMPVVARELDGVGQYALAFSAYFTTSLFGMVQAGQWADRRGPLAPLGAGIGAFAAGLVLAGTAGAMWQFVLGRAVQGLGGGLVIVALYVVVGRAYPERLRPTMMAGFAAGWVVPSIVGPLIAGTVTERLGWRWVFLGIPVLVVIPLTLALPQIRRRVRGPAPADGGPTAGSSDRPSDAPSSSGPAGRSSGRRLLWLALAVSLGAGLLQYAVQGVATSATRHAGLPLPGIAESAAGVAGLVLLVPAVLRLLPRGTWRAARGLPSVVLLRGIAAGAFTSAESFVPLMLVTQRGLAPTLAGLSLAAGGTTWYCGSWLQSRARTEPYRERLMAVGMVLVALAVLAVPGALVEAVPVWSVALAWGFGCFGMGLVISSTSVLLLKLSPEREAGANSAALQISDGLSNVLLLAACGALFAALGGGSVAGPETGAEGTAAASGAHPEAFVGVFLPMAAVALVGAWVCGRLRGR